MPIIQVRIKKDGTVEIDYEGFPNSSCDQQHEELIECLRQRGIELLTQVEDHKDEELLQEEKQVE